MDRSEPVVKLGMGDLGLLDQCARIEKKCAELYRYFEELFAEDTELSLLWRKTANEEDNHALQFKLATNIKGAAMEFVKAEHATLTDALERIETYIENVMVSRPSASEALKIALYLEEEMKEFHMSTVVTFADQEMGKLFAAMMNNDQGHVTMLQNALKKVSSG